MRQNCTRTDIRLAIGALLRNFNKGKDYDTFIPPRLSLDLGPCIQAQRNIGWVGFLEGFLSPMWAAQQEQYFQSKDQRQSGH